MAVFEKVVHGNLKNVIQNTDMLLKEGKHKLDFRDEYSMTSQGCYGQNLSEIQCDTGQFYLYYVAISG